MSNMTRIWLDKNSTGKSMRDSELLARAVNTIEDNIFEGENYPWDPYRCISPGLINFEGIWNWDSAFHAMAVSRWDTELAWESIFGFMKFQLDNGLIPDVIWRSGQIVDSFSKPPVFPWAVEIVYKRNKRLDCIDELYPKFVLNEKFWTEKRCSGGLFHYDCENKTDSDYEQNARYESGWDDSVRWDYPIMDYWQIDLNCYMIMFYRSMAFFADELGKSEDRNIWREKERSLTLLINERLWDDKQKCYVDVNRFNGRKSDVLTPASFMPMFIRIAPGEYAEYMNKLATDKNKFYSGMPTVAYDNPEYSSTYWRGPTWLNVAYFAAKGLKNYGFASADEIKETILTWVHNDKRGIFENYNSRTGDGFCCNHFSWSSAFIIEFICNF